MMDCEKGNQQLLSFYDSSIPAKRVFVLIVHDDFREHAYEGRVWDQLDVRRLQHSFGRRNCLVREVANGHSSHILQTLGDDQTLKKLFSAEGDVCLEEPDAFVLFVLSRGEEGGVIHTSHHNDSYNKTAVWDNLEKLSILKGKLKILFFGPSRGNRMEQPSSNFDHRNDHITFRSTSFVTPPNLDHYLIFSSCVEETASVVDERKGSHFVQSICDVFDNLIGDCDSAEFFTLVQRSLHSRQTTINELQTPQEHCYPHKRFKFIRTDASQPESSDPSPSKVSRLNLPEGSATEFASFPTPFESKSGIDQRVDGRGFHYSWEDKLGHKLCRGHAFIFYNSTTHEMADEYEASFRNLDFNVTKRSNINIMKDVESVAQNPLLDTQGCLVICIFTELSEGDEGLFMIDGTEKVYLGQIIHCFIGTRFPQLASRPKLFFFLDSGERKDAGAHLVNVARLHVPEHLGMLGNNHAGILSFACSSKHTIYNLLSALSLPSLSDGSGNLQQVLTDVVCGDVSLDRQVSWRKIKSQFASTLGYLLDFPLSERFHRAPKRQAPPALAEAAESSNGVCINNKEIQRFISFENSPTGTPKKVLVLIVHDNFAAPTRKGFNVREGDDLDVERIKNTFGQRNCIVKSVTNKASTEILKTVSDEQTLIDLCFPDGNFNPASDELAAFVLFVLSHGGEGGVIHTSQENDHYNKADLWNGLQTLNCLKGVLKFLFLAPCRGKEYEFRGAASRGASTVAGGTSQAASKPCAWVSAPPNEDDFLIFYSSVESSMANSDGDYGSWFVQKICSVLDTLNQDCDSTVFLTMVKNLICNSSTISGTEFQTPQQHSFPHKRIRILKSPLVPSTDKEVNLQNINNRPFHFDWKENSGGDNCRGDAIVFSPEEVHAMADKFVTRFQALGLATKKMKLENIRNDLQHGSFSSEWRDDRILVVCALAQLKKAGEQGISLVADKTEIPLTQIIHKLGWSNAPGLANTPKLLFFLDSSERNEVKTFNNAEEPEAESEDQTPHWNVALNNNSGIFIFLCSSTRTINNLLNALQSPCLRDSSGSLQQVIADVVCADRLPDTKNLNRLRTQLWSTLQFLIDFPTQVPVPGIAGAMASTESLNM